MTKYIIKQNETEIKMKQKYNFCSNNILLYTDGDLYIGAQRNFNITFSIPAFLSFK